jgi:hypothetical protein
LQTACGVPPRLLAASLALAASVSVVRADPAPDPDVAGAPVPGQESGRVAGPKDAPASLVRRIARAVLYLPKVIVELVLAPVRGGVWVVDRFELGHHYYSVFYNRDHTLGVEPTMVYQTGFGLMIGAKFDALDVFGSREHLEIAAAYGGNYRARAGAWLDSGDRFDRVVLRAGGNFDRFADLPFYGIGNADVVAAPALRVDPRTDDTAVETFYRYQELRAALDADVRVVGALHVIGRGAVTRLRYAPPTQGTAIDAVYDPTGLVGFEQDVDHLYGELELRWDQRGIAAPVWETTNYTTGWLASVFVGRVHQLADRGDFTHYGGDLQLFVHLGLAPRMLVLRLSGEGVTGGLDEVPVPELPYLGGDLMRGYPFARFRDRVSAFGTSEYVWDLSSYLNAFVFVDVGRVYASPEELTLHDLRVGYGGGLTLHAKANFLIAGTLASSIDGGLFVTATLTPLWNMRPRWR